MTDTEPDTQKRIQAYTIIYINTSTKTNARTKANKQANYLYIPPSKDLLSQIIFY